VEAVTLASEAGQFKASCRRPHPPDPPAFWVLMLVAWRLQLLAEGDPDQVLIFSLAARPHILTGYAGSCRSVGGLHGGLRGRNFHADPALVLAARAVGILFGLPSLRIKGFYLAARWRRSSSSCGRW
jgi:ABC-type branched-subunit amino acid transport system permease subunit